MDFVDEQHRPLFGVGQIRDQVFGGGERCAAGDLEAHAQLARNADGESGLAQARRTVEKDVPQRLAAFRGGIDGDFDPRVHFPLPDHLPHPLGTQCAVFVFFGGGICQDRFAGHT